MDKEKLVNSENAYTAFKDRDVDKMLEEWDIVECVICRKKISMLTEASLAARGRVFVCKGGCKHE